MCINEMTVLDNAKITNSRIIKVPAMIQKDELENSSKASLSLVLLVSVVVADALLAAAGACAAELPPGLEGGVAEEAPDDGTVSVFDLLSAAAAVSFGVPLLLI